ncbi:hypothetical protein V2J09_013908 [Rumex salicifolius]
MASMKLGSKSESFRREGHTWVCSSGLASDVTVEIDEMSFELHKFPLISRSGYLEKKIGEGTDEESSSTCVVKLDDLPGGSKAFELVSKFCYGVKLELTALNVVSLRCAGEYLEMTEEYGEDNLISQTETFLNQVFGCWTDTMKALVSCEEVIAHAEDIHIVSRCINSLAVKACADPTLFNWPLASTNNGNNVENVLLSPRDAGLWNGMPRSAKSRPITEDWWYEDVSFLSLPLYKRLMKAAEARGMKPDRIAGSLMFFAKRYLPSMNRQCSMKESTGPATPTPPESDQRNLLEEIVAMLPTQKGVTQTKFLLRLLRSAMVLHASPSCTENLEKRVGAQLDQASLVDLLVPNMGYDTEMTYDVDCVQRIVDYFMAEQIGVSGASTPQMVVEEEDQVTMDGSHSLTTMTIVAELVDSYLAEVASDANLKLPKFQALATVIPDYARPRYDESEREQICRIMNCQKLSVEASTHAASNERLPLRLVVQVLFFEQLKLRTQISNWLFMSENVDSSQNGRLNQDDPFNERVLGAVEDVKDRVTDLENECVQMKHDIQHLAKTKKRWSLFSRLFLSKKKTGNPDPKPGFERALQAAIVKRQEHANKKVSNLNIQ